MSMTFAPLPPTSDSEYFQGVWGRFFGKFIESGREKAGLSIEQAAILAGIGVEEWTAIEAGASLPTTRQQFQLIAAALDVDWDTMASIVLMCSQAWGIQ